MRLTIRTNLALRTLMFCAVNTGQTVRKSQIASCCNASENHLALVIHRLSQTGFLTTVRGRNGGVRLSRKASAISVGDVCRVFESCVPFAECFCEGEVQCPLVGTCRLQGSFGKALEAFYIALDDTTIADLTEGNTGLLRWLELEPA